MKPAARDQPRWIREDRLPTLEELSWLAGPEGRAVCAAMAAGDPADSPAAIRRWRERLAPERVSAAWTQVLMRAAARARFSRAADMLFDRVGLEQATGEVVAAYKARRFAGIELVADLCCGIGGDALALADGRSVVAVDRSAVRAEMARHNAGVYGRRLETRVGDVTTCRPDAEAAHVDPDRRPGGVRRHSPAAGSPGLVTLERIVGQYRRVAIKLSPGADFDELPFECEVELISERGECRQAVAWAGGFREAHRRATVLPSGESLWARPGEPLDWPAARPPEIGEWLYEPDPAVIRAGLVGVLARGLGLVPVDGHIAWLTGAGPIHNGLMHSFRVLDLRRWSARPVRAWLARHDVGPLEVKTRGFAAAPEAILKRLRPAGQRPVVLFLTRLGERPTAILAERPQSPDSAFGSS